MITIKEVPAKEEGSCNCCVFDSKRIKKPKVVYMIVVHHSAWQSTSMRLCRGHLLELQVNVNDALDPQPKKKAVGWQKAIEDNAKRRKA